MQNGCRLKDSTNEDGKSYTTCPYFRKKSVLVRLPCMAGETVWCIEGYSDGSFDIIERVIASFTIFEHSTKFYASKPNNLGWVRTYDVTDFGKTVFLDRAQAKAKLKEIGNGT
jgi:hypothetical protein